MLNNSQKADLVRATLATLAAYLTWVPLGYVLESNIAELLLKLFPPAPTRNLALQCLTEVRMLRSGWADARWRELVCCGATTAVLSAPLAACASQEHPS